MENVTPEQLAEALRLNEFLAHKNGRNRADDLIGVGHETIVRCMATFDPRKGFKFSTYCRAYLLRDHRRAFVDLITGVHIPHVKADYNEHVDGMQRVEIDGLPQWGENLASKEPKELRAALALLSQDFRELLELYYIDELSVLKLGKHYGLPTATIKKELAKAKRALSRAYLDGEKSASGMEDTKQKIVDAYLAGSSIAALAARFATHRNTITKVLALKRVPIRYNQRKRKKSLKA